MRFCFRKVLAFLFCAACVITSSRNAWAASCCGGGFAMPSLITGDEKASFSLEAAHSNVATDVTSAGIWQNRNSPETFRTLRLQGAHIFADRFQAGLSLPVVSRSRAGQSSTGLGDTAVNLGYEILPEWDYNRWRPRGVGYLSLILPTGRSIQESTDSLLLDARGRGFWAIGLGTTITKVIGRFDFVATLEGHQSFAKEIKTANFEGELRPGFGAMGLVGGGFNFQDTRLGASLAFNYEDAIETRGTQISSPGSPSRFATATLVASQMLGEAWSVSLSISDQTLFGTPTNTSLAQSIGVTAQHRFSR